MATPTTQPEPKIAFGAKVSTEFKHKIVEVAARLKLNVNFLMAAMAFESGETFSASVKNAAGSGAVGLIQFMPSTAKLLGTTIDALASMTAVEQLKYVEKYFEPYTGRLQTVEDLYMAILWPAAIGKAEDYVLFDKVRTPKAYAQNKGLDHNKDGKVTKQEATSAVRAKLNRGMSEPYLG